jgi:hypothetical protein
VWCWWTFNIRNNPLTWNDVSLYVAANLCPCWPHAQSQLPHFRHRVQSPLPPFLSFPPTYVNTMNTENIKHPSLLPSGTFPCWCWLSWYLHMNVFLALNTPIDSSSLSTGSIVLPKASQGDHHRYVFDSPLIVVSSSPWSATALYFFGSILVRVLKSKITVILTYAQKRYCGSSNYVKVVFCRLTIITITKWYIKDFQKSAILLPKS